MILKFNEYVKEGAIFPQSKLPDTFEMHLKDALREENISNIYIKDFDVCDLDDNVLFTIDPDKDSINKIIDKLKN
jgi:hypothetical protein